MDLSNGRMLVNTTTDIAILYKNMQTKILIENSEFNFAIELKNKKILMQLENKLIIFSDYVKQIQEIELDNKTKLKKIKLEYALDNYYDHCISILPNNNILIKINNTIKIFSENMEELSSIENLKIERVFKLSNNSLLVQVKNYIKIFSENMEELSSIENLNIRKIIDTIKDNLPTFSAQKK